MDPLEHARGNRDRYLSELCELLSIPSVSAQEAHKQDVERAARWLCDRLVSAGFPRADVMATPGHPIVYAEWLAAGPEAPTVLVYGHYDVQPPDPVDEWATPPFEPTVLGDDLYARGASDDKGQLYVHIAAASACHETQGAPPINVKFILEGEEEIGSPSLGPFIAEHAELLAADVALVSDTHILSRDQPSIVYALRGIAGAEVEVTGPAFDLHSGSFGGAVHNPIHALCAMVAHLHDEEGRIAIPGFYDAVRELSAEERAELARAPFDRKAWLAQAGVRTDWGEANYTIAERASARPTLDVNGIWGGYTGQGAKTVLPSKAHAKITMRLVPDQDPDRIGELLRDFLVAIAPSTVDVAVSVRGGGRPATVRRDSPAMRAAAEAYARAFGRAPVYVREGGSIPVVAAFRRLLGLNTILMGFGLPDDRLHSPNEKLHLPNLYRGIETAIHFANLLGDAYGGEGT